VLELAELIWSKLKPGVPFKHVSDEAFEHDIQRRVPDVAKAREVLGFETEVCLAEMLDEVIAWVVEAVQAGRI
jgi:UDP-glucose 4-epimerase